MNDKKISILVPVYHAELFIHKLILAIEHERKKNNWKLELILVDDGSKDKSFEKIKDLQKNYKYIKGIRLSRNYGHQAAVKTALSFVEGDYVAIIDDDMQDPPSLLPDFFNYLDKGYDVAFGIRKKRKESYIKKFFYALFYRILKKMSPTQIQLDSGDFCVMKKQVVDSMLLLQEKNPFLRGIRAWVGFKQIGVPYEREARVEGQSGYTLNKLFKIAVDGIFSFSIMPIRIITFLGFSGLFFAFIYSFYIVYLNLLNDIETKGFTSIVILISFFSSLTLICLGIIGEYIIRIYDEVRNRPYSIVAEVTENL